MGQRVKKPINEWGIVCKAKNKYQHFSPLKLLITWSCFNNDIPKPMTMFPPTIRHYPVALCFKGLSVTWKTRKKGQQERTGYEGMLWNQVKALERTQTLHRPSQLGPASPPQQQPLAFVRASEGSQQAHTRHWCSWRQEHSNVHTQLQCGTLPIVNTLIYTSGV